MSNTQKNQNEKSSSQASNMAASNGAWIAELIKKYGVLLVVAVLALAAVAGYFLLKDDDSSEDEKGDTEAVQQFDIQDENILPPIVDVDVDDADRLLVDELFEEVDEVIDEVDPNDFEDMDTEMEFGVVEGQEGGTEGN